MKSTWTPRSIYLYVVCLITLVMMIIGTVNVIKSVTEMAYPQPRPYPQVTIKAPGEEPLAPEAEARFIEEQREADRQWSRRNAVLSIVGNGALLVIAAPLYRFHWRQVQREREAAEA